MDVLIGIVYLGGLVFAVVAWIDALTVPKAGWAGHTKVGFWVAWYLGGVLTAGIVPILMAPWYWLRMRPALRSPIMGIGAQPDSRLSCKVHD